MILFNILTKLNRNFRNTAFTITCDGTNIMLSDMRRSHVILFRSVNEYLKFADDVLGFYNAMSRIQFQETNSQAYRNTYRLINKCYNNYADVYTEKDLASCH